MTIGKERRRYPRWDARFPVKIRELGEKGFYAGSLSRDISAGGIKIITDKFIPKGTQLALELFLENRKRLINAKARVAWLEQLPYRDDSYNVGLEFEEINPSYKKELLRLTEVYSSN